MRLRYKKAKGKFDTSKKGKEFDKYLIEELTENHRISEIEAVENQDRTKISSEHLIKSEVTITHKKVEETPQF